MAEPRGHYQELTEFSPELYDHIGEANSTPGQTPALYQGSFSGTEALISPPTTYQPSPDLNNPNQSASFFNSPPGNQGPGVRGFSLLKDSSFRENLPPEDPKAADLAARPIYNGRKTPVSHFYEFTRSLTDITGRYPDDANAYRKQIYFPRRHWLYIVLVLLSVYSTIFSGIYLFLALIGPRYGRSVRTGGRLDSSGASILTQIIAKSIEMSFVTVMVAFLGQILSRKAFKSKTGQPLGITLAEMNMRVWIMQPGLMVTRWESVRYAIVTVLGVVALVSAIVAMLYTTAADALGM